MKSTVSTRFFVFYIGFYMQHDALIIQSAKRPKNPVRQLVNTIRPLLSQNHTWTSQKSNGFPNICEFFSERSNIFSWAGLSFIFEYQFHESVRTVWNSLLSKFYQCIGSKFQFWWIQRLVVPAFLRWKFSIRHFHVWFSHRRTQIAVQCQYDKTMEHNEIGIEIGWKQKWILSMNFVCVTTHHEQNIWC